MNNIKLLEYCVKNEESFLDKNYMFEEKNSKLNLYVRKTKRIKELLITIKRIKGKNGNKKVLDQIFDELQEAIKKYANYSEFGCFINACDTTIDESSKNNDLLRKITDLYLKKRDLNDIVPGEWIQAVIDEGSSRRKGNAGAEKLINILKKKRFIFVEKMSDFKVRNKCIAKLSSQSKEFSNKSIKDNFKVSIGKGTQNKSLDLMIRKGNNVFFLEAKHLNTCGGGQNKQVLELIKIIQKKPSKKEYHFVAFLDGVYSNILLNPKLKLKEKEKSKKKKKNKVELQHNDIIKALNRNKNNYWVNTAGFDRLF